MTLHKAEESPRFRHPMPDASWREALSRIRSELGRLDSEEVRLLSGRIASGIEWLDPIMARYCELTCPQCEDPCCLGLEVFFNHSDLLYLATLDGEIPPGQTREEASDRCRYLGEAGCRLSRGVRPYVCVWFICDAQMEIFRDERAAFQRKFIEVLQTVRSSRLKLESLFEGRSGGS